MPATIFSGNNVKALKSNLDLNGVTSILSVNADPSSGAGVTAPLGSIAMDYLAGKVYKKTGSLATEWQELGAGLGGINYIENPDAESGTAGYSTYADAAGAQPVDGTGGTANITWTRSTTSPLRGVADFNLVKDAVNRQGQGVSYNFTIDSADQAKILTVAFDYEVLSGTYVTGDVAIYLIQDPSGTPVVIQPAGYHVQAGTVGTKMRQIATFQTASNVTSYRLCIHVASTSALAYTLAIDNVSVGPQVVQYGAPVTDWQSYTPTFTGFGTVSTQTFWWRRDGDSIEIKGRFTSGTSTATEARISFPSGLTSDSSKINGTLELVGKINFNSASTTFFSGGTVLAEPSVTYLTLGLESSATNGLTKANANSIVISGQIVSLFARVPILGWSSSVVVSSSTDTRVVAARAVKTADQSIPNNTLTKVTLSSASFDTHSAFDFTNNRYVIQVPGFYRVSALFAWATVAAGARSLRLYKNGSVESEFYNTAGSSVTGIRHNGSATVSCVAGDYLEMFAFQDSGGAVNISGSSGGAFNYFNAERLSGPSAIAASETVAARYADTSGQAIGTSLGIFKFATRDFDSHGGMNTSSGIYTVPVAGKYSIDVTIFSQAIALSTSQALVLAVYKNGALFSYIGQTNGNGAGVNHHIQGHDVLSLNAGDTLSVYISSSVAGAANTTAGTNHVDIQRIGN